MKRILKYLKDHQDTTIVVSIAAVCGLLYFIGTLFTKNAQAQVDEMLASSDPMGQLLAAVDANRLFVTDEAIEALDEIGDPLLLAIAPACKGEIVSTSPYDPDAAGPYPYVLLSPDGKSYTWTYDLLRDRGPEAREAQDVQLVICAHETKRKLETCQYVGLDIVRKQRVLTLDVIEAANGRRVESITFEGSKPGGCPLNPSGTGTKTKVGGRPARLSEVKERLDAFYE